jgi:hypothetical protein
LELVLSDAEILQAIGTGIHLNSIAAFFENQLRELASRTSFESDIRERYSRTRFENELREPPSTVGFALKKKKSPVPREAKKLSSPCPV